MTISLFIRLVLRTTFRSAATPVIAQVAALSILTGVLAATALLLAGTPVEAFRASSDSRASITAADILALASFAVPIGFSAWITDAVLGALCGQRIARRPRSDVARHAAFLTLYAVLTIVGFGLLAPGLVLLGLMPLVGAVTVAERSWAPRRVGHRVADHVRAAGWKVALAPWVTWAMVMTAAGCLAALLSPLIGAATITLLLAPVSTISGIAAAAVAYSLSSANMARIAAA